MQDNERINKVKIMTNNLLHVSRLLEKKLKIIRIVYIY